MYLLREMLLVGGIGCWATLRVGEKPLWPIIAWRSGTLGGCGWGLYSGGGGLTPIGAGGCWDYFELEKILSICNIKYFHKKHILLFQVIIQLHIYLFNWQINFENTFSSTMSWLHHLNAKLQICQFTQMLNESGKTSETLKDQ